MAQFKFYINDIERGILINYILSKKTKIIPDLMYSSNQFILVKNAKDFFDYLEDMKISFFLFDTSFELEPIIMAKNRFIEIPTYSIEHRTGGPYIDTAFYLGFSDDAKIPYKCSIIDYYGRFIHHNSFDEFKTPESLIIYFKDLVKFIKSMCKCVKKDGKNYWVSKVVADELNL
jgi:hypothetical protein